MKRIIYISVVFLLSLVSCTKEPDLTIGDAPLPDGSVRIALVGESSAKRLQTKADNNPPISDDETSEEYVRKIQVFFFAADNNLEAVRTYDATATVNNEITWTSGQSEMTVNRLTLLSEPKTIYVVTNWLSYTDIPIGSPLSKLTDQITSITESLGVPSKAAPILMSGCTDVPFIFHENDKQTVAKQATILIKRQQVKILFTLNIEAAFLKVITGAGYKIDPANEASIQVHNLPLASYITEQSPTKSPEKVEFHTIEYAPLVRSGTTNVWSYTQYSYENPILGVDENGDRSKLMSSTYFTILLPLKNAAGTVSKNYYRAYINDPTDTANPHKTIRNYIYNVSLTVVGFGLEVPVFESVNTLTEIENWDNKPLDADISGKDMTINKTSVTLNGNTLDNSLIARGTTNLDPSLVPNLFSEITYPVGMTEGLELGIERITGDDKSIRITIHNTATKIYKGGFPATFYIQYGAYKKLIEVYFSTDRPIIIGYFGGDPNMSELAGAGTMYTSRLAVARESSASLKYKTEDTANDPLIKNSIHYGRNMNIAATVPSEVDNYPAFAYCARLNKDVDRDGTIDDNEMVWYLPSQNQLMAMYVFSGGMDVPLPDILHWSATEKYHNGAWYVYFSTGNADNTSKTSSTNVRCVRDIKP